MEQDRSDRPSGIKRIGPYRYKRRKNILKLRNSTKNLPENLMSVSSILEKLGAIKLDQEGGEIVPKALIDIISIIIKGIKYFVQR